MPMECFQIADSILRN